jgi:hypothetical protein
MGAKLGLSLWEEENRLRIFEDRVLRKIFGTKCGGMYHGENCIMMNFTACILGRMF